MTDKQAAKNSGVEVAAGILINEQGDLLLAQRPEGKPWAGWWEFPGGKIEAGETVAQALKRELQEELGIDVTDSVPWIRLRYEYKSGPVNLNFCKVYGWQGEPRSVENQKLGWKKLSTLVHATVDSSQRQNTPVQDRILPWLRDANTNAQREQLDLLPASLVPIMWLQLPTEYYITPALTPETAPGFLKQLEQTLQSGCRMLQFRQPSWSDRASLEEFFRQVLELCRKHQTLLIVNSVHPKKWWTEADGVQLRALDAIHCDERPVPADKWLGISAHNMADVLYSHILNADFVLLGHVQETPSHPDQEPLGWEQFAEWAEQAGRPVYALGGVQRADLKKAQQHYAHGVAGISDFWQKAE